MKAAAKRLLFLTVLLAGLAAAAWLIVETVPQRYLYVDLGAIGVREGVFLALTLLLWIGAAFCATYVFYHASWRLLRLLVPLVLSLVLLLLGAVLLSFTADKVLCSYTTERADFTGQYEQTDPITSAENYYPKRTKGTVTRYAYFARGDAAGEEITLHFDTDSFAKELQRIEALKLSRTEENGVSLFRTIKEGKITLLRVDPRELTVTYGRYLDNANLPAYAPHA